MKYRYFRIALATLSFLAFNFIFLDFTYWGLKNLGWLTRWQMVPAWLSLNFFVLAVILGITYLGGRYYCSLLCPLGIYQDVVAHFTHDKKRRYYRPQPAQRRYRLTILIVFVFLIVCGFINIACLLDPYGMYGRIANALFSPLYRLTNNYLVSAMGPDSYIFYDVPLRPWLGVSSIIAVVSWIIVTVMAVKRGRIYCNLVCPVGTFLGLISEHSVFGVAIDSEKCRSCKVCERVCKGGCIDISSKTVDTSRCVVCGNCWNICRFEGIKYGKRK